MLLDCYFTSLLVVFVAVVVASTLVKSQLFKQIHFTFAAQIFVSYLYSDVAAIVVVVVMLLVSSLVAVVVALYNISCSFIV